MSKSLAIAGIALAAIVLTASLVSPLSSDVGRLLDRSAKPSAGTHDHGAAVHDGSRLTRVGDEVLVHVTIFNGGGKPVLTTDANRSAELAEAKNASSENFVLPNTYRAFRYIITNGSEPTHLNALVSLLIGDTLVGKPVGGHALVPVVGQFEGYAQTRSMDRWIGPFDLTRHVSNDQLKAYNRSEDGSRIQIDDLFEAEVLRSNDTTTVLRLLLEDGTERPVAKTPFTARIVRDHAADTFSIHLSAQVGQEFSVQETCSFAKYSLRQGSYRVESVNETAIGLRWSYTKFPQMMERDLSAFIEIIGIVGAAAPGGDH